MSLQMEWLTDQAVQRTGLSDFGDLWFREPLGILLRSLREEADLSPQGVQIESERQIAALMNRLYMVDALKRHPEIEKEEIRVAAVVVSLPRTGSTMMQRLLASTPGFTSMRWWEVFNYAPLPNERFGDPAARKAAGQRIIDDLLKGNPNLSSGHPYQVDAPEEETPMLGQFFVGTLMEGFAYLPSYVEWLKQFDHRPVYRELRTLLKAMQWVEPARRRQRWILKSSAHLPTVDAVCEEFPETRIIMIHRDPLEAVPSVCSLMTMLHSIERKDVDLVEVGQFTAARWAWNLSRYASLRESLPEHRFIDIDYRDLTADALKQVRRVFSDLGEPMTPEAEERIAQWSRANARDKRPTHQYSLERFGLTAAGLSEAFAEYRSAFGI